MENQQFLSKEKVLEKLAKHEISLGRAAELIGISIWEMIDMCNCKFGLTAKNLYKTLFS